MSRKVVGIFQPVQRVTNWMITCYLNSAGQESFRSSPRSDLLCVIPTPLYSHNGGSSHKHDTLTPSTTCSTERSQAQEVLHSHPGCLLYGLIQGQWLALRQGAIVTLSSWEVGGRNFSRATYLPFLSISSAKLLDSFLNGPQSQFILIPYIPSTAHSYLCLIRHNFTLKTRH
jgi:hypothetical protein